MHGAGSGGHRIARRQMVPVVIVRPLVFPLVRHLRGHPGVAREDLLRLDGAVAEGVVAVHVQHFAVRALLYGPAPRVVVGIDGFHLVVNRFGDPVLRVPENLPVQVLVLHRDHVAVGVIGVGRVAG